uniref:Uncharacterized protein n=1 Tax=Arcella intermedia TaxID=1963864 RepID=A0A6B2LVC0_9EUKA
MPQAQEGVAQILPQYCSVVKVGLVWSQVAGSMTRGQLGQAAVQF